MQSRRQLPSWAESHKELFLDQLYLLYINDLLEDIKSEGLLFADDTKIFNQIKTGDDALTLQADIDLLERWSKMCLLKFHHDKCHVLTVGKLENIRHIHRYGIYENELDHAFEEKDLGIMMDSELSFEEHISLKVKKANAIMGVIRRSFSFLNGNLFKKLYVTFVRPNLEYAQVVWAPYLFKYINMIKNVQIRATKVVEGLNDLEYSDRLKILDLPTFVYGRARGDMIEMYKHFHPRNRTSRSHDYQLHLLMAREDYRQTPSISGRQKCGTTCRKML